mmetsp:Transcript_329/g.479  ORF Transcript_329/g.479 Transcript_329/m.479 type:complete len:81 (-) Transcript_329:212-454(-)
MEKVLATKILSFTKLSQDLLYKVVMLSTKMEQAENQFMDLNSMTKILNYLMIERDFFQWLIQDQILTILNSKLLLDLLNG